MNCIGARDGVYWYTTEQVKDSENTAVVNDQQRENRTKKDIVKRNGRDGTEKYGRKDESRRRRKIDESSSRK